MSDRPYDAISSIGMFEHVGASQVTITSAPCSGAACSPRAPAHHAITRPRPTGNEPRSFIDRYVFPDSELMEVGSVITAMHEHGFEARDLESLHEHYGRTLGRR